MTRACIQLAIGGYRKEKNVSHHLLWLDCLQTWHAICVVYLNAICEVSWGLDKQEVV
ncbi:uncharacterized protein B0H18DRAFT_1080270 [Fomitopsis serialis]|uniref:uncharacterized protein n=1 Tax=Fomitopsis serialis TaxID=139415 RepID=UPI002008CF05|nr:uncharacterized protein B0H18DRAFT_1080270 [Neoantrodia serialis]KAH9905522.1 hypothetical protein B0H18DRAFT_1080270 [Neoantrodia serialis]